MSKLPTHKNIQVPYDVWLRLKSESLRTGVPMTQLIAALSKSFKVAKVLKGRAYSKTKK